MDNSIPLKKVRAEIAKCMKCGNCMAVCPIYKETKAEAGVARGKIQLAAALLEGRLPFTHGVEERLMTCLTCKACSANCPCGVKADEIILAARAAVAGKLGLPLIKTTAFSVLKRPLLFDWGLKLGSRFQGIFLKDNGQGNRSPRFPLGLDTKRVLPVLAGVTFRDAFVPVSLANPRLKVAFFTGCVTNYIYTEVGKATVEVLRANNIEVIVPEEQHCCGAPVRIHGDVATAEEMARSHVDSFAKLQVDAIITVCGTCGETFQHSYPELLVNDRVYGPKAGKIAGITHDISEFLVNVVKINSAALSGVNLKVTYHDPCHLVRGMGVSREPREILRAIPGVSLTELKNPARCCGGAGSFSLTHYGLSMDIHRHKADDIRASGAEVVVTGCGSCRMQLEDGLRQHGTPRKVMHTIEVLALAYAGQKAGDVPA